MSRSSAYIVVECDDINCTAVIEVPLTSLANGGWDERDVDRHLARRGWTKRGDEDICDGHDDDE